MCQLLIFYCCNVNRIMQLHQVGLVDFWTAKSQPDPHQCLAKGKKHALKSLTLSDLSGVFVLLLLGVFVSLLVFTGEQIVFHRFQRPMIKQNKHSKQ